MTMAGEHPGGGGFFVTAPEWWRKLWETSCQFLVVWLDFDRRGGEQILGWLDSESLGNRRNSHRNCHINGNHRVLQSISGISLTKMRVEASKVEISTTMNGCCFVASRCIKGGAKLSPVSPGKCWWHFEVPNLETTPMCPKATILGVQSAWSRPWWPWWWENGDLTFSLKWDWTNQMYDFLPYHWTPHGTPVGKQNGFLQSEEENANPGLNSVDWIGA